MWNFRRHILILKHAEDCGAKHGGLITVLSKNLGLRYKVTTIKGVSDKLPPSDMIILHVDLTVVPDEYIQAVASHPLVINRNVKNISKRFYSELILEESSEYSGEVIVKTDANFGGRNEFKIQGDKNKTQQKEDWEFKEYLNDYPIYSNLKEVPNGVWKNPKLIVEKFLPEIDQNGNYLLRIWAFFGDQEIHYVNYSGEKVIKSWNKNGYQMIPNEQIPIELRKIREKMEIHYGKFDYVMKNGKPILYDVNKTPGGGRIKLNSDQITENILTLTKGIKNSFKKSNV
ncbi:MAG: hypothetical protein V4727_04930 [Verrucomicrobiota bacterium]